MFNNYLLDPDVQLMLKFKDGDQLAFEKLLDKYQKRIINLVYRIMQDYSIAEDLAQDVFFRVYKFGKNYKPKAKFSTWIYQITKNACLNEIRKRKHTTLSLDEEVETKEGRVKKHDAVSTDLSAREEMARREIQELVKEAIESLPMNQRMAVVLRRYEELSYEEIAAAIGCSVSAVKSLLNRAKEALKDKLSVHIAPNNF